MKHVNIFLSTLLLLLIGGVQTTMAQSDSNWENYARDPESIGENDYVYLYNVTQKQFLNSGGAYGMHGILNPRGIRLALESETVSSGFPWSPTYTTYYYYTSKATEGLDGRTLAFDPTGMVVKATDSSGKTRILDNSQLTFSSVPATEGSHKVTITAAEGVTAEVDVRVSESISSSIRYTETVGATDKTTGFLGAYSDNFKVEVGETKSIKFTNYTNLQANWNNFVVALKRNDNSLYYWLRADNYGRDAADVEIAFAHSGTQWVNQTWEEWLQSMNGAEVTVYVTNCGNGTADVQIEMIGNDGQLDTQYYLGANTINPEDLYFALSVDGCYLVF